MSNLKDYFDKYERGDYIYPSIVMKELNISIQDAYQLCCDMEDDGLLTSLLEMYCPYCESFTGIQYQSFFEVPKEIVCPKCGKKLHGDDMYENQIVVYLKI